MDMKRLLRLLKDLGYQMTSGGGGGHWKVTDPGGRFIATLPSSPNGGCRSIENTVADLRRAGVPIPRKGGR